MKEEITNVKNQAVGDIMDAQSLGEIADLEVKYLGRSGRMTQLIKAMQDIPPAKRKETGILINEAKQTIQTLLGQKRSSMQEELSDWFDPTIPGKKPSVGNVHLITQAINEITDIFTSMGFTRERYPEVEWDWYSFGALNFPDNHPARDDWETFFVDAKPNGKYGPMILTPHTSSGQIREMEKKQPPIRMINIAKTYRRQLDATHSPMFHQFEGLVVDKGINISHLKGTLEYFAVRFYGDQAKFRIRPYDFQFTEPSFEVDFSCVNCNGKGCQFCKSGWHEVGGAGMVHPNVLKNAGVDPKKYSAFAFGWGVERTALLRKNINIDDIRTLYTVDLNYLRQF